MGNRIVVFAEERQKKILSILNEREKVTVKKLCDMFGISPVTARADLTELESKGMLKRTHGGAILASKTAMEDSFSIRERIHHNEKMQIAKKAKDFIHDGDSIILDSGTTILELARLLADKRDLTILTNDMRVASALENMNASFNIIVAGGALRQGYSCTVGPLTLEILKGIQVDSAFISTNSYAYGESGGFSTPDINQSQVKKKFIDIARKVYVLMDSSKLDSQSFSTFATLEDIDALIINKNLDDAFWTEIEKYGQGAQVVLA